MKIMVIADEESKYLWDFFERSMLEGIDLIISCGDLDPRYLSFLVTLANVPVLYVHGNHDKKYAQVPPEGCTCIEDEIFVYQGVRILGLGGSMRYKQKGEHQYTQRQMKLRVLRLGFQLYRHGGFDILLTHAPAYQLNDGSSLCHTGLEAFNLLLDRYHPRYFIHGHVHLNYGPQHPRRDVYGDTQVINAYESYTFDY